MSPYMSTHAIKNIDASIPGSVFFLLLLFVPGLVFLEGDSCFCSPVNGFFVLAATFRSVKNVNT